jgi:hypothetical protein
MKWIRNRNKFLNEARLRDVILPTQAKEVSARWGEKYLDYEEIEPTSSIEQGRWKLEYEDKMAVFSAFMDCDMDEIIELFDNLPQAFVNFVSEVASESIKEININKPTLDQLVFIFNPVFKKISVNDTLANNMISKDENGRPIKDSDGNMIRVEKAAGELVLTNNLVNINTIVDDYNSMVNKYINGNLGDKYNNSDILDDDLFLNNSDLQKYVSAAKDDSNSEYHWKYDVEIFEKDIYLSIKHNPMDILNMSISKFYSSCQHLYTGGHRSQLLANVFDPNSIPAFLIFDSPIYNKENQKISDVMPLSRMQLRKIETMDENKNVRIYFDRAYPDRMQDVFPQIVQKYTSNKEAESITGYNYVYAPDLDTGDENKLDRPYHDRIEGRIINKKRIGSNIRSLDLSAIHDWSNFIISPNNNLKELVIETTELPENLLELKLDLEWVKFKYLKLNTLEPFSKISYSAIAFEKCKFDNKIFTDILKNTPDVKKIKLISCDNTTVPNFSKFKNLEELHFIYTLDTIKQLERAIRGVESLKKLGVSGDLFNKQTKPFFDSLKSKGIKIEITGPSI